MERTPLLVFRYTLQSAFLFGTYFSVAYFSLFFNPIPGFSVFFWPAAGVALAGLYLVDKRLFPAIVLAAFLANFLHGAPLFVAAIIGIGNAFEAYMATVLLQRIGFDPLLKRLKDSLVFIATALSVSFFSAVVGVGTLSLAGELAPFDLPLSLVTWWIGDALGILIIGSFLIRWLCRRIQFAERVWTDFFENIAFFFTLSLIVLIVFWDPIEGLNSTPLLYLTFAPLTWGALRIGPRSVTFAVALIAGLSVFGTLLGGGPFAAESLSDLLLLQAYLGTVGIISLLFVATVEERKDAMKNVRQRAAELQEDVQDLSSADSAKNEFIAILSHELRNPLAPVLSSLELLRLNNAQMPHYKETIETMYEQIHRITRLLDDLLDITRISRKKFNLEKRPTKLGDVLTHSLITTKETLRGRQHTLTENIPDETIWLDADPLRLEQVVVNLLNNAAKYTEPGGRIEVSAKKRTDEKGGVEIRVRDNGMGIPPHLLSAIFEPFRQAHQGSGIAGLGIGLSLTKRFVELHGGTVSAHSAGLGMGSEFTVWLPTRDAPESPRLLKEAQSSGSKRKRTVLIVDDNEKASEAIAKLLTHAGHTVRTARDARNAFMVLSTFKPEIIVLDIGLPGRDGYDVAQEIRRTIRPAPLLVALTGFGSDHDKQRAQTAGFDYHLVKPIGIADLEFILTKDTEV